MTRAAGRPPIPPETIDDIVRFLTGHGRSGYGRIVLHAEAGRIVRATYEESVRYTSAAGKPADGLGQAAGRANCQASADSVID